jgi:[ribosomal protein S5]-alanine N-acetyltransferase
METDRLHLRPLRRNDAAQLRRLAGERRIADTMISIPHPYPARFAQQQIARARHEYRLGQAAHFAVTLKTKGTLIGAIELRQVEPEHAQAELSLWIGGPWQGRGYAQEAVGGLVAFGFGLGLNRLYAYYMSRNPASGRVLRKAGFMQEGLLRQRVRKWGVFEDVVLMALLRQDWAGSGQRRTTL